MYRTESFDQYLSEELKNADFAKEYFLTTMEELDGEPGLPFFEALKHVIRKMGTTEYAKSIGMERNNVSRILAQVEPPKVETLNKMLAPFKLKVKLDIEDVA